MKKLSIFCLFVALAACKSTPNSNTQTPVQKEQTKIVYTCSMHPKVKADKPGVCPKCGMELTQKQN